MSASLRYLATLQGSLADRPKIHLSLSSLTSFESVSLGFFTFSSLCTLRICDDSPR
jgi:hypothetical protein